ncbi:uncharacterized protein AMSG_00800 [Thecamonas trahens ATCC 50062]|uniref:MTOR-associated protein MEAK7 n=1 Tax=Thecamonas trahens ATCC 50062 TaxID=461836 RepID=A0A0L0DH58_THETB|nr:hypothetical protein AMSG_00800 [Thecamonas trahens ATCC 50062]KNC50638.1 hypothetical protein AMSG_00800 [Thecamonas trahens ATCC 50062]|eukprot:XP_013762524.1 hypothetical protein AMSG_00800 [Thecamonas trahens ATCC 50062]
MAVLAKSNATVAGLVDAMMALRGMPEEVAALIVVGLPREATIDLYGWLIAAAALVLDSHPETGASFALPSPVPAAVVVALARLDEVAATSDDDAAAAAEMAAGSGSIRRDAVVAQLGAWLLDEEWYKVPSGVVDGVEGIGRDVLGARVSALLVWMLTGHLPAAQCREWIPRYSSARDGRSCFHVARTIVAAGPTLVFVCTRTGVVIGGYAPSSWRAPGPSFYGTGNAFVFACSPAATQLEVWHATGRNDHYQYFNHGTQTLPNGLGMGGQLKFFGLFVDASFETGESRTCSTFGSPQLHGADAASATFELVSLDVYAVDRSAMVAAAEAAAEAAAAGDGSVLAGNKDVRALLEMAGVRMHSDGIRELDEDADAARASG